MDTPNIGVKTFANALRHVVGAGSIQRVYNDPAGFNSQTMTLTLRIEISPRQLAEAALLLEQITDSPTKEAADA